MRSPSLLSLCDQKKKGRRGGGGGGDGGLLSWADEHTEAREGKEKVVMKIAAPRRKVEREEQSRRLLGVCSLRRDPLLLLSVMAPERERESREAELRLRALWGRCALFFFFCCCCSSRVVEV